MNQEDFCMKSLITESRNPCGRLGGSSLLGTKRPPCDVELLNVSRLRKDLKDNKNAMLITTMLYLTEKAIKQLRYSKICLTPQSTP